MKKLLFFIVAASLLLASCNRDRYKEQHEVDLNNSTQQLSVPQDFDWKTSTDHTITIKSASAGMLDVTNSDGKVYQQAYIHADKAFEMKLTVPTWEKSLQVKFRGKKQPLELTGSHILLNFE